jgi:DNA polymerase I-like protein with 3'-5' exonuclease and polymerase domains
MNRLCQGSSGDQSKKSMQILYYEHGIVLPLAVHDELGGSICDVEEAQLIKKIMQECVRLEIPVVCDANIGPSWGAAKEKVLEAL